MPPQEPVTTLDARYSSPDAQPLPWSAALQQLEQAEVFWLTTVRPDGRPHVTSLLAIWIDEELFFSTGEEERKNRNLGHNAHCILTTGCNKLGEGLDVVVEGQARRVTDIPTLQRLADRYAEKYNWPYTVHDGYIVGASNQPALVYAVRPSTVFGFGKGGPFSQTRWRF